MVDGVDFDELVIDVVRQVKIVNSRLVFGPPKHGRSRTVPLPATVARAIKAHLDGRGSHRVTLPWRHPAGELVTADLIVWSREHSAMNRNYFNHHVWKLALRQAGVENPGRSEGFHALRHFYASVLLHGGESIKALSEYLGHQDAGFTLRTYTHLVPSSSERTRRAIDAVFSDTDGQPVGAKDHSRRGPAAAPQ